MSRYNTIDTVTFTDKDGNQYPVKENRPIEDLDVGEIIQFKEDMMIDEIISRRENYGNNSEDLTYAVVDRNVEKIVENDFDLSKIKELKIPIVTT